MTDAEIKNLRDLMRAATPGPWVLEGKELSKLVSNGEVWVEAVVAHNYQESNDAALIVAAVNALPGLLDEVERLRADLKETTERASQWVDIAGEHGAEVDVLRKKVERLRADAARLDHIEKHARYDPKMDGNHAWWPTTFEHVLRGPTLRAAIDAAMGGGAA